jgi:hypothetical protein
MTINSYIQHIAYLISGPNKMPLLVAAYKTQFHLTCSAGAIKKTPKESKVVASQEDLGGTPTM